MNLVVVNSKRNCKGSDKKKPVQYFYIPVDYLLKKFLFILCKFFTIDIVEGILNGRVY